MEHQFESNSKWTVSHKSRTKYIKGLILCRNVVTIFRISIKKNPDAYTKKNTSCKWTWVLKADNRMKIDGIVLLSLSLMAWLRMCAFSVEEPINIHASNLLEFAETSFYVVLFKLKLEGYTTECHRKVCSNLKKKVNNSIQVKSCD